MRKFIINFLLSTLSKKQKKQILKELKKAIKLVTRKRGKRWPYKKTKVQPIAETKLPPVELPEVVKTKRTGATAKLRKLERWDLIWFKQPLRNIAPIASGIGQKERKTFQCSSIWPHSTEVKRVA